MALATRSPAPLRVKQHCEPLRTREFFESIDMNFGLRKSFQLSDRVTTNDARRDAIRRRCRLYNQRVLAPREPVMSVQADGLPGVPNVA